MKTPGITIGKNTTKCNLLGKFANTNESEWLEVSEEGKENELKQVQYIFESNGTKISALKMWDIKWADMATVNISFRLTRANNDDQSDKSDVLTNLDKI